MPGNNNNKNKNKTKVVVNHKFSGCRDALTQGGTGAAPATTMQPISTNASGNGSGNATLCPVGLTAPRLNASGIVYDTPSVGNVAGPQMRGLYYKALDFQWYRVTRAKLVFVGVQGSTATGTITLAAYTDPLDASSNTTASTVSSASTRTFDIANSSSRELSVPIPVDTSWKKVTSYTMVRADAPPFFGASNGLVAVNSVADLAFAGISWYVAGSAVSQPTVGNLFIDYDVEFKSPIDFSLNN